MPFLYTAAHSTFKANLPLISIFLSGIVWGLCWWPLKFFANAGLTGNLIGMTAYGLVGVAALPVIWRQRRAWQGEGFLLLAIGFFFGFANIAFTTALMLGEVVRVMLLFYLLPIWGALGGVMFLGERLGTRRRVAVVLSLTGVFVIMGGNTILEHALSTADILALISGFCYSAAGIVNNKAIHIPMASRSFVPFVFCPVLAVIANFFSPSSIPDMAPMMWLALCAFAFIWLLGGTLFTTYGVAHIEASRASVLQVIELLVAIVSALLIGGEMLTAKEWIGGAMIIGATLLESMPVPVTSSAKCLR
ncbi:MAG: DMT family transporter [Burkholderiaceae bacterium]